MSLSLTEHQAYDYSRLPSRLKALARFIGWKLIPGKKGKARKIPVHLRTGKAIDAHDKAFHTSFEEANRLYLTGAPCDGLGIVICKGDGLSFIDFDDICSSPDKIAFARRLGTSLRTWGEISVSGKGAHFICGGIFPRSFNRSQDIGVEGYSRGRFVALTGRQITNSPNDVIDNQSALDDLYHECCNATPAICSESAKTIRQQNMSLAALPRDHVTAEFTSRAKSALARIPADDRDEWLAVGMALHSTGRPDSRSLWDEWSKTSEKYDQDDQESTWKSFDENGNAAGKVSIGTLFHLAKSHAPDEPPAPEYIEHFNAGYFVSNESGCARIYREEYDAILNRHRLVRFQKESFLLQHANEYAIVNGNQKPAAQAWLASPLRRTYPRIVFAPGASASSNDYNLWRGFSVTPRTGNWSLFHQHILDVVCQGNCAHYNYILGWMASAVQRPDRPGEVALVIKGGRGTGKGTFARAVLRLFGQHGMQINHGKHLTGNFNSHLRDCIVLNVDEGFWAGDKQAEGVLKGLITEPTLTVEGKGRDAITAPNYLHIIITSNEDWVVPAGPDERRFAVFDVAASRQRDESYFNALNQQLENGGYEAMLFDLLNYDLNGFSVRRVPNTTGLQQQKLASLDPVARWLFEKLAQERLHPVDMGWVPQQSKKNLTQDFADYARRIGRAQFNSNGDATTLGSQLKKIFGSALHSTRTSVNGRRDWYWVFPPLAASRTAFEGHFNLDPVSWNHV